MELIQVIINVISISISLLSLFVLGGNEKVVALIGIVIMLALTIFLKIKIKLLKSDKEIIEECIILKLDIKYLIKVFKDNIDLNTFEGKELLDIILIKENSLNKLINNMNNLKGKKLEYSVYLPLKKMLKMLEMHKSLYFS